MKFQKTEYKCLKCTANNCYLYQIVDENGNPASDDLICKACASKLKITTKVNMKERCVEVLLVNQANKETEIIERIPIND